MKAAPKPRKLPWQESWHFCCFPLCPEHHLRRRHRLQPAGLPPTPMDPPSPVVSLESLQRRAYLLWEAAGFPPDQSDHFWLKAEQQLTAVCPAPAVTPARKPAAVSKRKTPATPPVPAAEAAPVHPTRRKPATKSTPQPAVKAPAKPVVKAPGKPAAKSPHKTAAPPPAKTAAPAAKRPAKPRSSKTGDAS